jgi:hypothetical protein
MNGAGWAQVEMSTIQLKLKRKTMAGELWFTGNN